MSSESKWEACLDRQRAAHKQSGLFRRRLTPPEEAIPEARPNQAYRFMKLACQYGDTLSCEDMDVQCIPDR
jgi:hypothetical protein